MERREEIAEDIGVSYTGLDGLLCNRAVVTQ